MSVAIKNMSPVRHTFWLSPVLVGTTCWTLTGDQRDAISLMLLGVCSCALVISTYTDTRTSRIPNWVTYASIVWFLMLNLIASITGNVSHYAVGISESVMGLVACGGAMLMLYTTRSIGAGDVKLAAALGSFLGVNSGIMALVWCYVLAGFFCAAWMVYRLGVVSVVAALFDKVVGLVCKEWIPRTTNKQLHFLDQSLPMAAFFTGGVVLVLCGEYLPWTL